MIDTTMQPDLNLIARGYFVRFQHGGENPGVIEQKWTGYIPTLNWGEWKLSPGYETNNVRTQYESAAPCGCKVVNQSYNPDNGKGVSFGHAFLEYLACSQHAA